MSWLGVLLIGYACADLAHAVWPRRLLPECVGAVAAVTVGLLAGLSDPVDLVALVAIAVLVLAWGYWVTRGFGRGPVWPALVVFGGGISLAVLCGSWAGTSGGLLGDWLSASPWPRLADLSADRALLLIGLFAVQLSTGNVLVRLVLAVTGTLNPARPPRRDQPAAPDDPELRLKGGRLLGPMERIFILGLGLAGDLTAAAIVIAAKGLLRFPELNSRAEQERVHRLTEYFLVGSFASWLIALGALVLTR